MSATSQSQVQSTMTKEFGVCRIWVECWSTKSVK